MTPSLVPTFSFPPLARLASCAMLACTLMTSTASAAFINLGPAGDFNVYVVNDNTQNGSDAQGKVAVGGNANFGSFTVASQMPNNTDNLIVGGNLTNSGTTFHGGLFVNGNVNWASPTILGKATVNGDATFTGGGTLNGPVSVAGTYNAPGYYPPNQNVSHTPTPMPFSFSDVSNYLVSQAQYLASLPANGTTNISFNQVHLTANNPADNYVSFNVTGAQMAAAAGAGLFITAPAGSTVVVNISGTADSMTNMGISLTAVDKQHVLYNFYEATSLTLSGIGVMGSILAPQANVNFTGAIDGTMIAKNLTGPGESHNFLFQGNLPLLPVPEPSTVVLALCGVVGLAMLGISRKRRQS
jgi:choice-of-anchor A domain-containing protein